MISPRYAPALCVLMALALVPTVLHTYAERPVVDGRHTNAIPATLAGMSGMPTNRNQSWGQRRFGSEDWLERRYVAPGEETILTVVRSRDLKALYHHPELAVAYGRSFTRYERARLPQEPAIPIHVLRAAPGRGALAMYVLHYDDRFVEDPFWFQLRIAGELLFSRRQTMTLFFVNDLSATEERPLDESASARVLLESIDAFLGS